MGNFNAVEIAWTLIALVLLIPALYCLKLARSDASVVQSMITRRRRRLASSAWMTSDAINYVVVLSSCFIIGCLSGMLPDRVIEIPDDDPYHSARVVVGFISAPIFFLIEISTSWAMLNSLLQRGVISRVSKEVAAEPITSPTDLGLGWLFWAAKPDTAIIVSEVVSDRIVLWNASAEALWGYTAIDAAELYVTDLMPGRFRPLHDAGVNEYIRTDSGRIMQLSAPMLVAGLHRDGSEIPIELMLGEVPRGNRPSRYVLAVARLGTHVASDVHGILGNGGGQP